MCFDIQNMNYLPCERYVPILGPLTEMFRLLMPDKRRLENDTH